MEGAEKTDYGGGLPDSLGFLCASASPRRRFRARAAEGAEEAEISTKESTRCRKYR